MFNQLFATGSFGNFTNGPNGPLSQGSFLGVSTTLFALDLGAIFGILALFTRLLAQEEKGLVAPELLGYYRRKRNVEAIVAGAFFMSALPVFWTPVPVLGTVRFAFWLAPFVVRRAMWLLKRGQS